MQPRGEGWASGFGPLCAFANVRKCAGPGLVRKQGGGRGAVGAQAALALAARGFPAMLGLRSHRETRCTHCVRCARTLAVSQITKRAGTRADLSPVLLGGAIRPACAPPAALREQSFLGVSEGQAAGIEPVACRAPQARVQAPAGLDARLGSFSNQEPSAASQSRGRVRGGAPVRRRGAEGFGRRAYARASSTDSPHLFERSERSERSELCGATETRAPQRSRRRRRRPPHRSASAHPPTALRSPRCMRKARIQSRHRADCRRRARERPGAD